MIVVMLLKITGKSSVCVKTREERESGMGEKC